MKKSKEIIGSTPTEFARIITKKLGKRIIYEISGESLDAEVNHGRWIARCPYCSGAEIADSADPVFMCLSCFNEENGGRFRPVRFPVDLESIETELKSRKNENHQNWIPGESLEDLKCETREKESDQNG